MALRSIGPAVNRADNTHRLSHGKLSGVHSDTIACSASRALAKSLAADA
jgi:hypothetical protein